MPDMPSEGTVQWKLRRVGDAWECVLTIPGRVYPTSIATQGPDKQAAVHRAAILADQITSSPIFQAVAPPGTMAAVKAIKFIAGSKDVQAIASKFVGPGAKRLIGALGHIF